MSNATITTERAFSALAKRAEQIKSDADGVANLTDAGDELRQGDVYVTRIGEVPPGAVPVPAAAQLAPGTTQGSRHSLRSLEGVRMYRVTDAGPLDGPVVVTDRPVWVDHPEHGNRQIPAGAYAVTYQRAFADELRRVQD